MANNSINLVDLDFDSLKTSLKTYLKSQAQFADYDFDGSNMSVLLDILAYNTYQNTFYLNMIASEMFLDSAQLKSSIVSLAKALNYTPRSNKSAQAVVDLQFAQSGLTSFSIPEGTRFIGRNSNTNYTFVTGESMVIYPSGGYFTANNVKIYQGTIFTDSFVSNYGIENQRFILTNDTIDSSSIKVLVREDSGSSNTLYVQATSLYDIDGTSNVFFVQAADNGKYEVVFGDGTFGRKPKNGAIISAQYRSTIGMDGNYTTDFTLVDNLGTYNGYGSSITPTITVINAGYGGADAETIEEIRFRAPKYFQTQERAIAPSDFSTLITQRYQDIKSVYVYGGETVSGNPQYGKVYISPATFTGEILTDAEKADVEAFIRDRCTIGITPVVIDSDILYLVVESAVLYNPSATSKTAKDIQSLVKTAITDYNDTYLKDFDTIFKQSKFESVIDGADASIDSNNTSVKLKKEVYVELNNTVALEVRYRNALQPGTITSSSFVSGGKTYEYTDYNPNINTFTVSQSGNETVVTNSVDTIYLKDITIPGAVTYTAAGTVDYNLGIVRLNAIAITDLLGENAIKVYANVPYGNISSKENDTLEIDIAELVITVTQI